MNDPTLFTPPAPSRTAPGRPPAVVIAKRLRVISNSMQAARRQGVARSVSEMDISDLEHAAAYLENTE